MPNVPPSTIQDVPAKQRSKLTNLIYERSVLGYAFSYTELHKLISELYPDDADCRAAILKCLTACEEKVEKSVKAELDDKISAIYSENGLKGIRSHDPFNREIDVSMYENSGIPRIDKTKLIEFAPTLGISTKKILELIELATVKTPFVAMTVRGVKSKENGD